MSKKALLAVLMAMILLLSSCALVVKDQAVDDATVIMKLGDKEITKKEIVSQINSQLNYNYQLYSAYGLSYDPTDPETVSSVQDSVIEAYKKELVITAKAKELGLDQLTDEEKEKAQADAQEAYDSDLDYVKQNVLKDTEGMEEEAIAKAAEEEMTKRGLTFDVYLEDATASLVSDKVHDYAIKDVAVTDEEIQAEYDSKVEADRTSYAEAAGSWAAAANNGTTLYYTPAGVRRVKQILTKFHDEDQTAIDDAKSQVTAANTARTTAQAKIDSANETLAVEGLTEEEKAKAQEDLDAAQKELEEADSALLAANQAVTDATDKAFANIDAETDEILASLAAEGADWQAIMDEKNQDPGMKDNEKGYAVAADMTNFDSAFVEAAMALEKPGDISGKVKGTSYGYYIIRYESDEAEGPVSLDAVKDGISSSLLSSKQTSTYNDTLAQWVEEAGIKVDLNALKD